MYCLAMFGGIFSWVSDDKFLSGLVALSTVVLIWSNVFLNIKKGWQLDRTGDTKPEILTRRKKK